MGELIASYPLRFGGLWIFAMIMNPFFLHLEKLWRKRLSLTWMIAPLYWVGMPDHLRVLQTSLSTIESFASR
jgi:hypothetical protein